MKKIIVILLISSLFYSCVALRFPDKMEININVPSDFDIEKLEIIVDTCLLYTSPSPRDRTRSRMPSSA